MSVDNPRAVIPTLTDGMLAELARIFESVETAPPLPKRDRRNNRCPHKFINQGKGLCWICDPSVAAQDKNGITGSMRRTR
jgi:hypothetical protein